MKKVLAFGAFDPLHQGHEYFLNEAKKLGDHLTVVVARDSSIRATKAYEPYQSEEERLMAVMNLSAVDEAVLGNKTAHHYEILSELEFDVVALGYDQTPSDDVVRRELNNRGKHKVAVVRLKSYHPKQYKSTFIRRRKTPTPSNP